MFADSTHKKCNKCKKVKLREEFNKCTTTKDGLRGRCKNCISEYNLKNKEKLKEKAAKYYKINKEKLKEKARKYHWDNREEVLKRKKEYYNKNKEEIIKKQSLYAKNNKMVRDRKSKYYYEMKNTQQALLILKAIGKQNEK